MADRPTLPAALLDAMVQAAVNAPMCEDWVEGLAARNTCIRCRVEAAAAALLDACEVERAHRRATERVEWLRFACEVERAHRRATERAFVTEDEESLMLKAVRRVGTFSLECHQAAGSSARADWHNGCDGLASGPSARLCACPCHPARLTEESTTEVRHG